MSILIKKLTAFIISIMLISGFFGETADVKTQIPIRAVSCKELDISDGVTVTVPAKEGTVCFNRVSFTYEATAPVRAVFRYRQGVKTFEEELLLSSRESCSSMLLDGYLQRKSASRLLSVRFEPIVAEQECTLTISDFTCDLQTAPKGDVLYIENDRFKAGVMLKWGGGLCYFEDKRNDTYGNLLNCHDTGRLVQQSYYGPVEIDGYENGFYPPNSATPWNYNPVQGGDQYGNTSKLVALETTDNRIRVVCRPLDWALNNRPTQTCYTCVYELTPQGLRVENTAVDFLQTEWIPRDQEIPAFYAISALGNFVFYDGDAPWTGAPLRVERELAFCGGQPSLMFRDCNDEKWCAWTDDSGYGVGLYTPIAQSLLAGRFLYDGTADPDANPTNYVAPLGVFVLRFDEPFTYDYYLTGGTVDEIRSTFSQCRAQ